MWMDTDLDRVMKLEQSESDDAEKLERLNDTLIKERFSYLASEKFKAAVYQVSNAGTINPRAYVRAMTEQAKHNGAERIYDYAARLENSTRGVMIQTAAGRHISAEKVLLATGAYAAKDGLLGRKLALRACKTGVVLVKVAPEAVGEELANMPSIISRPPAKRPNTYLLPPLMYPDGKYYLKIGTAAKGPSLNSSDKLNHWLRVGEDHATADLMLAELRLIFPYLDLSQWRYLPCATCHTPDARPIVDVICGGKVGLLLGGNGYAGKSGDALGELGATLILGKAWQGPIAREELSLARFETA
jgi:sarcosine oxidase